MESGRVTFRVTDETLPLAVDRLNITAGNE